MDQMSNCISRQSKIGDCLNRIWTFNRHLQKCRVPLLGSTRSMNRIGWERFWTLSRFNSSPHTAIARFWNTAVGLKMLRHFLSNMLQHFLANSNQSPGKVVYERCGLEALKFDPRSKPSCEISSHNMKINKVKHITDVTDKSLLYRSVCRASWVLPFQFRSFACSSKTEQWLVSKRFGELLDSSRCQKDLATWQWKHLAQVEVLWSTKSLNALSAHCASNQVAPSHFFASVLELQPTLCRAVLKHGQLFVCCSASSCENEHEHQISIMTHNSS